MSNTGRTHFKKGCVPWNKGTKGLMPTPWNKGKKGLQVAWNKSILFSEASKKKMSESHKGHPSWSKGTKGILKPNNTSFKKGHKIREGIKHTQKTKDKIGLANKGKLKGNLNPSWKGGITPYTQKLRNSKRYEQWRDAVYKRDNYTCQDCGDNKGGNLNAHHEIPFAECLDLDYEEMIFNINNGTTYCEVCHGGL